MGQGSIVSDQSDQFHFVVPRPHVPLHNANRPDLKYTIDSIELGRLNDQHHSMKYCQNMIYTLTFTRFIAF